MQRVPQIFNVIGTLRSCANKVKAVRDRKVNVFFVLLRNPVNVQCDRLTGLAINEMHNFAWRHNAIIINSGGHNFRRHLHHRAAHGIIIQQDFITDFY